MVPPSRVWSPSGAGALGIVVGAVVDGVPESIIFGIQLASGEPLSIAFITAAFLSNIPQALSRCRLPIAIAIRRTTMIERTFIVVLALMTGGPWFSSEGAAAPPSQGQAAWLRADSQRFEIHYQPALARDLDRVVRSAEGAYDRVSRRLSFVLATKVPLVVFASSGPITQEQVAEYAASDQVTPPRPHRSRIVLPLPEGVAQLDTLLVHELAHLLMCEIILPGRGGDGGVPRWVHEGIANYMVGVWSDEDQRLMRELVGSGNVPALSQLTGSGGFANARVNDALGHAAFDYIESRWGSTSIRRFLNALIVPRVDKTYDAVFDLTPAEFDAAFRDYVQRRFRPAAH